MSETVKGKLMNAFLRHHRRQILEIADRFGVTAIRVFGSCARGDAGSESDVDFLVTLEAGRSLFDLIGLKQEISDLLERPVDVVTERALHPNLRETIEAEAVAL